MSGVGQDMAWTISDFSANTAHDVWNVASLGTLDRVENQKNLGTMTGVGESLFQGVRSISNAASLGIQEEIYEAQMTNGAGLDGVSQGVQNWAYNTLPMEEGRALIQDWDTLSTEERIRLGFTAVSKTASLAAGAKGAVDTAAFKRLPQPTQNRIVGNAARDGLAKSVRASGQFDVLGNEVTVKIPAGRVTKSGQLRNVTRKYDLVVRNRATQQVGGIEVKAAGTGAVRDSWQIASDRWVNRFGARTTGVKSTGIVPRINSATTMWWPAPKFTFFGEIYAAGVVNSQTP